MWRDQRQGSWLEWRERAANRQLSSSQVETPACPGAVSQLLMWHLPMTWHPWFCVVLWWLRLVRHCGERGILRQQHLMHRLALAVRPSRGHRPRNVCYIVQQWEVCLEQAQLVQGA